MSWLEEEQQREQEKKERLMAAQKKFVRQIIGGVIAVSILIIAIVTFFNSYTVIKAGYEGAKYSLNGGIKQTALKQGWRWHSPFDNVKQYPISKETVYLGKPVEGKGDDNSIRVNTSDGKSVDTDVTYAFAIEEGQSPYIALRFRKQSADTVNNTFIKQQLKGAIQSVTTRYSVVEVYGGDKRAEITKKVQDELTARLGKDHIILEDFSFQDIRPDETTLLAIQKIVDAKNQEELLKQQNKNLQQEQVNKKLQAETDEQVALIQARQEAEQKKIATQAEAHKQVELAKAEAEKIRLEGEAQAKANRELSASVSATLNEYIRSNAWNGQYPTTMTGSGTDVILDNRTTK